MRINLPQRNIQSEKREEVSHGKYFVTRTLWVALCVDYRSDCRLCQTIGWDAHGRALEPAGPAIEPRLSYRDGCAATPGRSAVDHGTALARSRCLAQLGTPDHDDLSGGGDPYDRESPE